MTLHIYTTICNLQSAFFIYIITFGNYISAGLCCTLPVYLILCVSMYMNMDMYLSQILSWSVKEGSGIQRQSERGQGTNR